VTLICEDLSRIEPLDSNATVRRIMVDVWYPAERSTDEKKASTEYLDVAAFERALGVDGVRKQLGGSYEVLKTGVATHALAGAIRQFIPSCSCFDLHAWRRNDQRGLHLADGGSRQSWVRCCCNDAQL
jgi:hypothetical protein